VKEFAGFGSGELLHLPDKLAAVIAIGSLGPH
jgi:hypothetical protein